MGALPKNKITRAERGKRRAGNTRSVTKDFRTARIPSRKAGLVQSMFAAIGLAPQQATEVTEKKSTDKKVEKHDVAPVQQKIAAPKANKQVSRQTRITQHKG